MSKLEYWRERLREAEADLAAAKKRTEVDAAASRFMLAKTALKRLEAESAERPKRRPTRDAGSAGASS
jgi:hypothetical protein